MSTSLFTFAMAECNATTKRLNFANMSDAALMVWESWFAGRHEQDYDDPRQRSYFRINEAGLHAERMWRNKEIPF